MAGFPSPNIGPIRGYAGGIPQFFSSSDPHSFFPGVPQGNIAMSRMLGDYGANDAELAQLMSGYDAYGTQLQKQALAKGKFESTNQADQLAKQYASAIANPEAAAGLAGGSDVGTMAEYGARLMGTTLPRAEAQRAAAGVPGQIELQKQAVQNAYRQNQMKGLAQMLQLAANQAGNNYGYQAAQLSADRGQIGLANAQNQEQMANMQGLLSMLFGQNMSGLNQMGGGFTSGGGGSFLDKWLGSTPELTEAEMAGPVLRSTGQANPAWYGGLQ